MAQAVMGPVCALLGPGNRLHLQHGPIDLIIGADGARALAFDAARARFETVLSEIVSELDLLRTPLSRGMEKPKGQIARRMFDTASLVGGTGYVTSMAAVAGSVAETVLAAMVNAVDLRRAYVNNGGDIAVHLAESERFEMAMARHDGQTLGRIEIAHGDPIRGIATSGRHGRSMSMGIADSVTVLAKSASVADVAATMIANAVDLPGHSMIRRASAIEVDDNSDMGTQLVVTGRGALSYCEVETALANGQRAAQEFVARGHIAGACLFLDGQACAFGHASAEISEGTREYA